MKSPNPSNIDQWLFHYFEGDLSPEDETLLEGFLLEHPQFDQQFETWGAARMSAVNVVYNNQGALLKPWVTPVFLNRVAVFTAISINAVLASLIIFNNPTPTNELAMAANHGNGFEFSYARTSQTNNPVAITTDAGLNKSSSALFNRNTNAINPTPTNQFMLVNPTKNSVPYEELVVDGSSFPETNINAGFEIENHQAQEILSETHGIINPTAEPDQIEVKPTSEVAVILPESVSLEDKPAMNERTNERNENNASVSPDKKSDNDGRERNLFKRSNRFKGGDLLLSNSRDVEYLVPGMTRNQLNFAHVASDFSNTLYTNTYLQWPGQEGSLIANQIGYDFYLPEAKSGVGVQMIYDRYANGAINNFELSATYSPKLFLTKNIVLEPALRFRMGGTTVDRSQFSPGTWVEYDRANAFMYTYAQQNAQVNRSINQDLGVGFLLNTKWGFVGANADNLMGSRNHALYYGSSNYDNRTPLFFNAVLGTQYESVNKKLRWSGQMVYQNFGNLNKLWFGSRIKYNYLSLGASVSSAGEPMLSFGVMARNVSLLYSTDYSYSQLTANKHLSHQITMRITLKESRMRKLLLN